MKGDGAATLIMIRKSEKKRERKTRASIVPEALRHFFFTFAGELREVRGE